MSFSIIIPVYNEQNGLVETLDEIRQLNKAVPRSFECILVNDGSTDNTAEVLDQVKNEDLFKVITHEKNQGYGASLKTGIRHSIFNTIVITDADRTYPNHRIPELVQLYSDKSADMVVGSRSGVNARIPAVRKPAKWCLNQLAEYLANRKIPDLNSGLRVMNKTVVQSFFAILPNGFSFTTTISLAMLTNGHVVYYEPIDYFKREGKSKIRPIRDTLNFIQLIVRTVMYFDPLKVFLPMSLSLFLVGVLMLLYRIFIAKALITTIIVVFVASFQILSIGMLADLIDKRIRN